MIQFISEHPHIYIYIWCALGIVSGLLVWNVGKEDTDE